MRAAAIWIICFIGVFASSTYQLPLKKGVWHLVGINGFHGAMPRNLESNGDWTMIIEAESGGFTWDYLSASVKNDIGGDNKGDELSSTIGLKILPSDSDLFAATINYEALPKEANQVMLGMFVASEGEGRRADLEIRFQANYKGKPFYIKFNDGLVMQGVFDPKYTQGAPAQLAPRKDEVKVTKIADLIDANLSDNNLSAMDHFQIDCESLFCSAATIVTGGRQKLLNGGVTAYSWNPDSQTWATYGSQSVNNDFDSLEEGKAYWIRVDSSADINAGLILAKGELGDDRYNGKVALGWNMLSFNDGFLRNAPSAVFVGSADLNGLKVRDNFAKNIVEIVAGLDTKETARNFNAKIAALNAGGENGWKIRAYPAKNGALDGIVLISDEDFGVALDGLKTIAKQELYIGAFETPVFNTTRTDEHILALRLNSALFSASMPKNAAIQLGFAGDNLISSIDLSGASDAQGALTAVSAAIDSRGATTNGGAVLIDADFSGAFDTLLIAANKRVYARDATFLRLFDYNDSLSGDQFLLRGVSDALIAYDNPIADKINSYAGVTGVVAYNLPSGRVLLSSIAAPNFELKELGRRGQWTERYLYEENGSLARGAIGEVYSHFALANAAIKKDGTPYQPAILTGDLSFVAQFSADFPTEGALYSLQKAAGGASAPNIIIGGVTRGDDTIAWRQSDLSVSVDSQRVALSRFNLYKLHKDRGYWVYMRDYGAQNKLTSGVKALERKVTRRYSNHFDGAGSNALATARNQIALDISIDAIGLEGLYANQTEMPENIFLNINGVSAPMLKNGASHNYFVSLSDRDLEAIGEKPFNAPQAAFGLYMTSGLGARLIDERIAFDTRKPRPIEYAFDTITGGGWRGGLRLQTNEASKLYIYEGNLSDNGNNDYLIYSGATNGELRLNLLDVDNSMYNRNKPYYDLRIIGEAPNELQSDIRRLFYAPLYNGTHLLSANAIEDGSAASSKPIAFSLNGQSWHKWVDNAGVPADSGVQLSLSLDEYNATDSNTTTLVYYPKGSILSIGGTRFTNDLFLDGDNVGKIVYTSSQSGDLFYFYHKERNKLAYGYFDDMNGSINLTPIDSNQTIDDPRRFP
ncbi:MAG: hypothetical protein LBC09_00790 [Helicobacteraceae bacterium]|jgi:hypothetical protein|nr:hypothetical protein [Helicobacteraceae bacterium]